MKFNCNFTNINKEMCVNSFDMCCGKLILGWMAPQGMVNESKAIKLYIYIYTIVNY
jgi:hypothetical protein